MLKNPKKLCGYEQLLKLKQVKQHYEMYKIVVSSLIVIWHTIEEGEVYS